MMGDYNADGYDDVVVVGETELCPEAPFCGEAILYYGPDLTKSYRFEDPPPGKEKPGFWFRAATGDFNDDSIDDLVLSMRFDEAAGWRNVGSAYLFYGPDLQHHDYLLPPNVGPWDVFSFFGVVVETGDLTGDGLHDLAISAPQRDNRYNGTSDGMVFVYDFSTRFPFRSYGICSQADPVLTGEGDGRPYGSSRLVVKGLSGGTALLLVGSEARVTPLPGSEGFEGCGPRLLVVAENEVNLGSGSSEIEYVLTLARDFHGSGVRRLRFQVLELTPSRIRTSNGVVWTVRS
jgi:hypothetical protein